MNQNNTLDIRISIFVNAYKTNRFKTSNELYEFGATFLFLNMEQMDNAVMNYLLKLRSC